MTDLKPAWSDASPILPSVRRRRSIVKFSTESGAEVTKRTLGPGSQWKDDLFTFDLAVSFSILNEPHDLFPSVGIEAHFGDSVSNGVEEFLRARSFDEGRVVRHAERDARVDDKQQSSRSKNTRKAAKNPRDQVECHLDKNVQQRMNGGEGQI